MHNFGSSNRFIGGGFAQQEVAASQKAKELFLQDAQAAKSVFELIQCLKQAFCVPSQLNIPILLTVQEFKVIREKLPEPTEAEKAQIQKLVPQIERAFSERAPFFKLNPESFCLMNAIQNPIPNPFSR